MKLTVLGGGGVRTPLLIRSILNRADEIGFSEVCLMDNDPEKLRIYGGMAKKVGGLINPRVLISLTEDPVGAVTGADYIITTLRVGQEKGRTLDERIALDNGVIGQETTGPGGFAMAMRSIPALLGYAELAGKHAKKGAKIFNFTNPAGLVSQAFCYRGFQNVYGICDGPSHFKLELEEFTGTPRGQLELDCFGLNHLSFYSGVRKGGRDILGELIGDPLLYQKTEMRLFDPGLARDLGMLLNEYLYYFYHREKALANIQKSGRTRGETIYEINRSMSGELSAYDAERDFDKMLEIYVRYYAMREDNYMAIESGGRVKDRSFTFDFLDPAQDDGGYAGVALDYITAHATGKDTRMILMVPNRGAIPGLLDDDVVEITCTIGRQGERAIRVPEVPELQMNLIRQMKLFERRAARAILARDIEGARLALMIHPLVNSYSLAKKLLSEYMEAHREYIGDWT